MTLDQKRWVIGGLGFLFLLSLVSVQWLEVERRQHESGAARASTPWQPAAPCPASSTRAGARSSSETATASWRPEGT